MMEVQNSIFNNTFSVVLNEETAECSLCDLKLLRGDGIILQQCHHTFCKNCTRDAIKRCDKFQVPCPLTAVDYDCGGHLLLGEIKAVLPIDQYISFLETPRNQVSASGYDAGRNPARPLPAPATASNIAASSLQQQRQVQFGQEPTSQRTRGNSVNSNSLVGASGGSKHPAAPRSDPSINILLTTDNTYCGFCAEMIPSSKGIMLQNCLHAFCKTCLQHAISSSDGGQVPCPIFSCEQFICEREIKSLVSKSAYEEYSRKGFKLATESLPSFKCKTRGCTGVCLLDLPDRNQNQAKIFLCPICNKQNCLNCAAIHEGIPCEKWVKLRADTDKSVSDAELLERSEDVGNKQFRKTIQQFLTGMPKDNLALYYDAAELVMEQIKVLPTHEEFECLICSRMNSEVAAGGIVLQECSHAFCKECLEEIVRGAEQSPVACPYNDGQNGACSQFLTSAEFKALASPEVYQKHVRWGWKIAEDVIQRKFSCLQTNCEGFWEVQDGEPAGTYICPVCESTNCVKCNVIHNKITCGEYQEQLRLEAEKVKDDANRIVQQQNENISAAEVQRLITARNFMRCPFCSFVCEKISGCAHVKCLNRACAKPFNWYN